ncbi:MAG TPA: hypothetical protein VE954_40885 [Oligoflexus sp.]|uniref:hypothetical protein n=1 Tax=Oligoflexus sp. TaxID=1971216 RepID=UPI002D4DD4C2|nr:hypothetical protein [Oligoflexus sp.]HYX39497.1 hypothetical protein [Oligoflexus sp.]
MFRFSLLVSLFFSVAGAAQASGYYQLNERDGVHSLRPLSRDADCPKENGRNACSNVTLELPERCSFECKNALLSGQGTAIIKGSFSQETAQFVALSGFDTWRARSLPAPVLKITSQDVTCEGNRCRGTLQMENLKTGQRSSLKEISFAEADDKNYQLDGARAQNDLKSADGLLVTGSTKKQVLKVRYVFRVWISEAACDALKRVQELIMPAGDPEALFNLIQNENEIVLPADGRTLYWAQQIESDVQSVTYKTGINDLWSQIVSINLTTCAATVLAEH